MWSISIFNLVVCIPCVFLHTQKLSRVAFNGILYQEPYPWSKSLLYSKTIGNGGLNYWRNLSALTVKHGLQSSALFCTYGSGGWLAYPEINFTVGSAMSLQIMVGETCIKTDKVASIQSLGPINIRNLIKKPFGTHLNPGLLTFENIYYTSGYTLTNLDSQEPSVARRIKSLIHTGPFNWTVLGYVLTHKGEMKATSEFCLLGTPKKKKKLTYCGIPDIDLVMGEATDKIKIKRGCQKTTPVVKQSCYSEGYHTLIVESEILQPPTTCKKYLETIHIRLIQEYAIILEIWNLRMTNRSYENMHEEKGNIAPRVANHLHDLLKYELTNSKLGFLIHQINCPMVPVDYITVLTHLFGVIANHIFRSMEVQTEKQSFVDAITAFHVSLDFCNLSLPQNFTSLNKSSLMKTTNTNTTKTCQILNDTKLFIVPESSLEYLELPFVNFFPHLLNLLMTKCSDKFSFKEYFYQKVHNFLSHSRLDWNAIYEVGLNGLNIGQIEQQILHCLSNVGQSTTNSTTRDFNNNATVEF